MAEYNPLHLGHSYHLRTAREKLRAWATVVVLSSDFVQRGEPACLDKMTRARMALANGVDLVLELPVLFSCHNAGVFAKGAIDLLAATGVVTDLAFGVEDDLTNASTISDILIQEPLSFKESLRMNLSEGYSFVEARAMALESLVPGAGALLAKPNNSLALAYLTHIRARRYPMVPCPVRRIGAGYHDEGRERIMSATGVRKAVASEGLQSVSRALPPESKVILGESLEKGCAIFSMEPYWRLVRATLIRESLEHLRSMAEMGEGIERRLKKAAMESHCWDDFLDRTTSRRYPRGRIQRHAAHVLLGVDHWTNRAAQRLGPPYIRVLGAREKGRFLLREMRDKATLPVVTKSSGTASSLGRVVSNLEHVAASLWEGMIPGTRPRREAETPPLML